MTQLSKYLEDFSSFVVTKPKCKYCAEALQILHSKNITFKELPVSEHLELSQEINKTYKHMTYPMVFLDKKFVGGCSDLKLLIN